MRYDRAWLMELARAQYEKYGSRAVQLQPDEFYLAFLVQHERKPSEEDTQFVLQDRDGPFIFYQNPEQKWCYINAGAVRPTAQTPIFNTIQALQYALAARDITTSVFIKLGPGALEALSSEINKEINETKPLVFADSTDCIVWVVPLYQEGLSKYPIRQAEET